MSIMAAPRYGMLLNIFEYNKRMTVCRNLSKVVPVKNIKNTMTILGQKYLTDEWTNVSHKILSQIGRNLHVQQYHPLSHIRQRIVNYFYSTFYNRIGNPIFSVHSNISPIVSVEQNFDSLLVPPNHPSRQKSDCYYINKDTLLRAHMTAHQAELISMGLDNFLMIGDVYRRDEIDSTHYPVFHQVDAVRTCTLEEVFQNVQQSQGLKLFEQCGFETPQKQDCHSLEAVKIMEYELKNTLAGLTQALFGHDAKYRWVEASFPFTHPSWELEICHKNQWIELLGCGIMRHRILERSGIADRIGWAFGLGLERLAMCIYNIPDIRLLSSNDSGFLNQFKVEDPNANIEYQPVSVYPQCFNDISFWLPDDNSFVANDFYDIVRNVGVDMVEQIIPKDVYTNPKTGKTSHCYQIVYRHMERTLTQDEVTKVHTDIAQAITEKLKVSVR